MSEEIFHKILNNTANEEEKRDFFTSLENDHEKKSEFQAYKNLYVLSSLNPDNYRSLQDNGFKQFWRHRQSQKSLQSINQWMRYAAIFVIASVLGFMANYVTNSVNSGVESQNIAYSSEKGSVSKIHMEDGSSIWLSSGTSLVINKNPQGEMVAKLNGEAYFDLIPDSNRNFVVDLGLLKVRDIGTRFNVRAYETEKVITTALIEGKIDLLKKSGTSFMSVNPGEFVKFDKESNETSVIQQDLSIVTAWTEGKFVFIDKTLAEICTELKNWYNVEIQIESKKLANTRYTSVVKRTTTVQMVLKILSITDQIKYEITDKKEGKDIIRIRK